jgi:DNA-binding NtrC family response regulator
MMNMDAIDRRPFKDIKREIIDDFERRYLYRLLEQHRFNLSAAGRTAGLSRKHICALIQKHGLYKVRTARGDRLAGPVVGAAWACPPQAGG